MGHTWVPKGARHRFYVDFGVQSGRKNRDFLRFSLTKVIEIGGLFQATILVTFSFTLGPLKPEKHSKTTVVLHENKVL